MLNQRSTATFPSPAPARPSTPPPTHPLVRTPARPFARAGPHISLRMPATTRGGGKALRPGQPLPSPPARRPWWSALAGRRGRRGGRDAGDVQMGGGGGDFIRHPCPALVFGAVSETSSKSAAGGGHDRAGGNGLCHAGGCAGGGRLVRQRGSKCARWGSAPLSSLPRGGCLGGAEGGTARAARAATAASFVAETSLAAAVQGVSLGQPPAHVRDLPRPTHPPAP